MKLYIKYFSQCSIINYENSEADTSSSNNIDIFKNNEISTSNTPFQILSQAIGINPIVSLFFFW